MHRDTLFAASLLVLFTFAAGTATAHQTPSSPGGGTPLERTYWRAIELAGKSTPEERQENEAHLRFEAGRVSGADGCNRLTGSYQLNGDRIAFGQMANTQMLCAKTIGTEEPLRDALKNASRLTVAGDRLELFDAAGTRLAAFAAASEPPAPAGSGAVTGFAGTSWQLVKFQSMDDTVLTPHDRAKYTIDFLGGGRLTARVDCNRGHGTWKSAGLNQIEFSPLALTRAHCPGPLNDQIARQWGNIRSYVLRDGHLFLALKMDSGIYEFEPMPEPK
jgi:heat shock protein HslJ